MGDLLDNEIILIISSRVPMPTTRRKRIRTTELEANRHGDVPNKKGLRRDELVVRSDAAQIVQNVTLSRQIPGSATNGPAVTFKTTHRCWPRAVKEDVMSITRLRLAVAACFFALASSPLSFSGAERLTAQPRTRRHWKKSFWCLKRTSTSVIPTWLPGWSSVTVPR